MSYLRMKFLLGLFILLTACAVETPEIVADKENILVQVTPAFPGSEIRRGREGWVIIAYAVDKTGFVKNARVKESSGSLAFEGAALDAVSQWRYVPGEEKNLTLLVAFLNDKAVVQFSPRFIELNKMVHEFIDYGRLDVAEALVADIRKDGDLTVSEMAYTFLAEERIAGSRGKPKNQLASIRMAMLNDGRWLLPETFASCLHAAILLEIEQGEYASALHDYEILAEMAAGRVLAAELRVPIQSLREQLEGLGVESQPYLVANSSVLVRHAKSNSGNSGARSRHKEISAPPSRQGAQPPPRPPPSSSPTPRAPTSRPPIDR